MKPNEDNKRFGLRDGGLIPATLLEKKLQSRCSPVNFMKLLNSF